MKEPYCCCCVVIVVVIVVSVIVVIVIVDIVVVTHSGLLPLLAPLNEVFHGGHDAKGPAR